MDPDANHMVTHLQHLNAVLLVTQTIELLPYSCGIQEHLNLNARHYFTYIVYVVKY